MTATSRLSITTETKLTAVFVLVGVVLWLGARTVTESAAIQFAALVGVGVIVPTVLNELRGGS
jgi:hypothetical protein